MKTEEITAPALPVTPLTDEQKAELKQLAEGATPGPWRSTWDDEADPADLNEVVVETVAPQEKPYGSVVVGLLWYDGPHAACTRENSAYIAAANPAATLSLLADNARLSLLLEEERRTGEVALKEAQERADAFRVSLIHSQQFLGQDLDTPRKQYEAKGVHTVTQRMLDDPKFGFYNPLIAQAFPAPAAPCQRDCQKCEKAVSFFPCVACGAKAAPECLGDSCEYSTSVLPGGGAGVGLQGEPNSEQWQVPGMPQAKCHGCGLPSHVARCRNAECPMKPSGGLQGEEGGGRG